MIGMWRAHGLCLGLAGALGFLAVPSLAAGNKVGEAIRIDTRVLGRGGEILKGGAIHKDERIRTNASGVGSFLFDDGTKLAVGPNSSIVIDKYIYSGDKAAKALTITAAKGTFRWISGKSSSSAYKIGTSAGTIGVRGTAFDIFVGTNGLTAVVLLSGKAEFCNSKGCQKLERRCDFLIAKPNGEVSKPRGLVRQLGEGRKGEQTFPFLAGLTALPRGFKVTSSCQGLTNRAIRVNEGGSRSPGREELPTLSPKQRDTGGSNGNGDNSVDNGDDK